jgi:hypothetical protein
VQLAGLGEVQRDGRRRFHPWSTVRAVTETETAVVVTTDHGTLRFAGPAAERQPLAEALANVRPASTTSGEVLSPEEIGEWLGLDVGEVLELKPEAPEYQTMNRVLGFSVVVLLLSLLGDLRAGRWAELYLPLFVLLNTLNIRRLSPFKTATTVSVFGIDSADEHLTWEEVDNVTDVPTGEIVQIPPFALIHAGNRSVQIDGPHRERVVNAVRQLLEAKQAGAVLPRLGGVPDSAISRTESVDLPADRGLSRPE